MEAEKLNKIYITTKIYAKKMSKFVQDIIINGYAINFVPCYDKHLFKLNKIKKV